MNGMDSGLSSGGVFVSYSHGGAFTDAQLARLGVVAPEVVLDRGYGSILEGDVGVGRRRVSLPALVVPVHGCFSDGVSLGSVFYSDAPLISPSGCEMECVSGSKEVDDFLDCLPMDRARLLDVGVVLWICDSVLRADCLTSMFAREGVSGSNVVVAINGPYGWRTRVVGSSGRRAVLLPDFDRLPLKDRHVRIVFDSGVSVDAPVNRSVVGLSDVLARRGSRVLVAVLGAGRWESDRKVGIDGLVVAGFGYDDLLSSLTDSFGANGNPLGFMTRPSGERLSNDFNAAIALADMPETRDIFFDEFRGVIYIPSGVSGIPPAPMDDRVITDVLLALQGRYRLSFLSRRAVEFGIENLAYKNRRNLLTEYVDSLEWDERLRINDFFINFGQAEDTDYNRAVSARFWFALAARALFPSEKLDFVVIMESPQGSNKNRLLMEIGKDWYVEASARMGTKDFIIQLRGAWIVSLSELSSIKSAKSLEHIKAIITSSSDTYRPPYCRYAITSKRQCVFVGTTNDQYYLTDPTGNRRFLPIRLGMIDIDAAKDEVEQCLAEAVYRIKAGEKWWDTSHIKNAVESEQLNRVVSDIWEPNIQNFLSGVKSRPIDQQRFHLADIIKDATSEGFCWPLCAPNMTDVNGKVGKRICDTLRKLGWASKVFRDKKLSSMWYEINGPLDMNGY